MRNIFRLIQIYKFGSKEITFARNLVKGKVAETVFAQMLRSTGAFTVLEFGYEKIIPELVDREK